MLKDLLPAKYRKAVYALYALAATTVGALQVAEVSTGKAVDVIAYLGIAVGAVAASNTSAPDDELGEDGAVSLLTVAVVAIAVVLVLWFFGVHGNIG